MENCKCGNNTFYHRHTNWIECTECSKINILKDGNVSFDLPKEPKKSIIFKVHCMDQNGTYEENGFFLDNTDALKCKLENDNLPTNIKYGIEQNITEIKLD